MRAKSQPLSRARVGRLGEPLDKTRLLGSRARPPCDSVAQSCSATARTSSFATVLPTLRQVAAGNIFTHHRWQMLHLRRVSRNPRAFLRGLPSYPPKPAMPLCRTSDGARLGVKAWNYQLHAKIPVLAPQAVANGRLAEVRRHSGAACSATRRLCRESLPALRAARAGCQRVEGVETRQISTREGCLQGYAAAPVTGVGMSFERSSRAIASATPFP
jgi:hypothetical protein